jgi:prepilin-type N-terminal cleavage/methylation domain-containing protein
MNLKEKQFGFSLIEIIISLSILLVVLGGVTSMAVGIINASSSDKYEIEAISRAQRQLELAKQYRNTNLLDDYLGSGTSGNPWDSDFFDGWNGTFYIDNSGEVKRRSYSDNWNSSETGKNYSTIITIDDVNDSDLGSDNKMKKITATTSWEVRGDSREVSISTILTGWYWEAGE